MSPLDFSRFFSDATHRVKPRFTFLGKSIQETETLLRADAGLYLALAEANPDLVTRAGGPNSKAKCLIAFQYYGCDTTYTEIAAACGIGQDSAYQHMQAVRQWLEDAFRLKIERSGDRVFIVNQDTLRERTDKLIANLELLDRQFETVKSCASSLQQSGQAVVLPATAQIFLKAHEEVKQLAGTQG
jgi:hypothetical protein